MTGEITNDLTTALGLLAMAVFGAILLVIYLQSSGLRPTTKFRAHQSGPHESRYQPSIFEESCRWCAIRNRRLRKVQKTLGLHNPIPCTWGEGTSRLNQHQLFVSPPIRGWILVVGNGLPDPAEDVDRCFHLVTRLSRALGQVQFFSCNRPLNHHAWVKAESGKIRRAYAWAGETLWNQGEPTPAEHELEMQCHNYGEQPPALEDPSTPKNSEKVNPLAARWSFDPATINEAMLRTGWGLAGNLAQAL